MKKRRRREGEEDAKLETGRRGKASFFFAGRTDYYETLHYERTSTLFRSQQVTCFALFSKHHLLLHHHWCDVVVVFSPHLHSSLLSCSTGTASVDPLLIPLSPSSQTVVLCYVCICMWGEEDTRWSSSSSSSSSSSEFGSREKPPFPLLLYNTSHTFLSFLFSLHYIRLPVCFDSSSSDLMMMMMMHPFPSSWKSSHRLPTTGWSEFVGPTAVTVILLIAFSPIPFILRWVRRIRGNRHLQYTSIHFSRKKSHHTFPLNFTHIPVLTGRKEGREKKSWPTHTLFLSIHFSVDLLCVHVWDMHSYSSILFFFSVSHALKRCSLFLLSIIVPLFSFPDFKWSSIFRNLSLPPNHALK